MNKIRYIGMEVEEGTMCNLLGGVRQTKRNGMAGETSRGHRHVWVCVCVCVGVLVCVGVDPGIV